MRGTLFAALAAVLSLMCAQGQSPIVINESGIRAVLENESTSVAVPIESTLDHEVRANLSLDWIGKDDRTLGTVQQDVLIRPGRTSVEMPLPISEPSIWLRLRYSLVPDRGDARAFVPQSGIVALPQIAEHVFELKITHVGMARPGSPFVIHAQAIHPVTRAPVQGLKWNTRLTVNGVGLAPLTISSKAEGFVDIVFDVPPANGEDQSASDDQAKVWVQGRRGDFLSDVLADVPLPMQLSARIQVDKPIYQPGQTIHLRAVVLDPQGRAMEGAKLTVEIKDEDSERIHTAQVVSSRFGVIQDDYALPSTAALGAYQIALKTEGDDAYAIARHVVRVSRYELPTFSVTAKPDRAAYLPDQKTKVFVTGAYFFGKPVPRGSVKVIRSGEPHWNPKTNKHEATDETLAEGQAGEDGTFVAELDLRADHDDLGKSEDQRFRDVHFAAYYTDPSSRRTEQRRFDVRLTREPIHVYIIGTASRGPLPVPVYVSTDYADGRPASTQVELRYRGRIATLHTNQYGVGRALLTSDEDADGDDHVEAQATDSNGQVGTWTERYWRQPLEYLRLDTGHTIFRSGESVAVQISAPLDNTVDEFVMLNALAGDRSVASRIVRLVNGKAEVTFPYQSEFRRTVIFTAWNAASVHNVYGHNILGEKAVIFPDASDLRVTAATERAVYKPGENATLRMQVSSADGRPVEAALGLAVVDQAVLERARTDNEFGQSPWFSCAFCGNNDESEIGGIRLNDLYALKTNTAISSDMDLAAEALVARAGEFVWSESGESLNDTPRFAMVTSQFKQISSSLDDHYAATLEFPKDISALSRILGTLWTDLRDPWGMPYTATFSIERNDDVILLTSSGPDKRRETQDDFVAGTFRRSYFAPVQMLIKQALPKQDYPEGDDDFRNLLRANGLLLDTLRDPWGSPYRASVETRGTFRRITISSAGPDRNFGTPDDFVAATFDGSYFERERAEIARALQTSPKPPQTPEEFQRALANAGIDISKYQDAWRRPYHLTSTISSRYSDRFNSTTVRVFGGPATSRTEVIPITQRVITFALHSAGPDGVEDTYDDFDIARFVTVLKEESAAESSGTSPQAAVLLRGTGAITGVVTDPSGAVVARGSVILIDAAGKSYETSVEQDGVYRFASVPSGVYSLRASSPGFNRYDVTQVPVTAGKTTAVDITLQIGAVTEQVTVEARAAQLNTETSALAAGPTATPRVREYFPETLLWMPEVITGPGGSARTQVTLADSVTTWKVAAIASTLDGRIG